MSQRERGLAAAATVVWVLVSCSTGDAHGPPLRQPDGGAENGGLGGNPPADADAASHDRDAGSPGTPGPEAPLPMVELAFKNDSSTSVYYAFNGCYSDLLSVVPSQPAPPESADDQQFWRDLAAGDGCVCSCADLERAEICTRDKCQLHDALCPAILGYHEIAPGTEVADSEALFTTVLDRERACVAKQPYPEGTELTARFCWWSGDPQQDPGSTQACGEARFFATDAEVSFKVTDELLMRGPDDAG